MTQVKKGTERDDIEYDQLVVKQINLLLYNPNPLTLNEVPIKANNTQANAFPVVLPLPSPTIGLSRIPPPNPILVFFAALIANRGLDALRQGRRPGELSKDQQVLMSRPNRIYMMMSYPLCQVRG